MATRKTERAAEQLRISQIGDFKERIGGVIELPSGLVVRWRNPGGLRAFITSGKIPNVLMNTIQKTLKGGPGVEQDAEQEVLAQIQENPELLTQMTELFDSVARRCIVEPKIWPTPDENMVAAWNQAHPDDTVEEPDDLRYEDRLYADEVPDEDKQYLFQLISGGVKDLETFRQQREINVDSLAKVSGVAGISVDDLGTDIGKS